MNRVFYAIMLIVGVSIMIMPLSVPVFKSSADYSVLNTDWNGVSSFGKLLYSKGEITPVLSTYDSANLGERKGTLIIVGPNLDFTNEEIVELRKFLENGNTLILADDFGTGNEILEGLGLEQRFGRGELITPIYSKNHHYPVTAEIVDSDLSKNVERIVMYNPSVILNSQNALVYTPNSSIFKNSYGAFVIVEKVEHGNGEVILISDPDLFTNSLFRENEEFIKNILDYASGPFYIDEAHHRDFNPYSSGTITIRRAVNKEFVFYYILLVAAIAFIIESGLWLRVLEKIFSLLLIFAREEKESLEEIIKSLEKDGLNRELLIKIINEIKNGSKLGGSHGR
ncbi:DUF4350 domain-containing protein [Thermococcus sibiricus]|uniref:DUF4350 domain-containing protein n=1 Tax=Thermococcus sibiricus TaxID=172049 RepID=A0A101EKY5_9EURY|nr:DUF4350 domain-containing protein [Thermococcus sibiricus]KUK17279.1 MAG: Uncharacterized protein XD54_1448 [Thermococcus sibiricus]KUK28034.1 MAG: Uncharacterized protein XD61_1422 [Thermococcus sp. 40_45]